MCGNLANRCSVGSLSSLLAVQKGSVPLRSSLEPSDAIAAFSTFAQNLVGTVPTDGHRHAGMPEGLEIVMQRFSFVCGRRRWRLALAREQIYPSTDEVESCRLAFVVPPSAVVRRFERCRTHPKTGRRILYHVAELIWLEQDSTG